MNKKNKKQLSTNRGIALFIAVLMGSIALTIGMGVLGITLKELKLSSLSRDSMNAFFAADTGLECALYWDDIRTEGSPNGIFGVYGPSSIAPVGAIGYWKLDGDVSDSSGNGNDGTIVGNPSWDNNGVFDQALSFDGIGDYVNLGSNVDPGTGDFSVSLWYKGLSGTMEDFISFSDVFGSAWYVTSTNTSFIVASLVTSVNYTLPDGGIWHNITITFDRSTAPDTLLVYIDGVSSGTVISTGINDNDFSSTGNTILGGPSWLSEGDYRQGSIDDVRIYDRALSGEEVSDIYNATAGSFTPPVSFTTSTDCTTTDECCMGKVITNPLTGWDTSTGWVDNPTGTEDASITFDIGSIDGPCATIVVTKDAGHTKIDSRGYNNCDATSGRRVERGLRVSY